MIKEYDINKTTVNYNAYYGVSSVPIVWKAHEVKINQLPDRDVIVYRAKSGWIGHDRPSGETIGKQRAGIGWLGFDTAEESVENFILQNDRQKDL